jgi:hypothetical protein
MCAVADWASIYIKKDSGLFYEGYEILGNLIAAKSTTFREDHITAIFTSDFIGEALKSLWFIPRNLIKLSAYQNLLHPHSYANYFLLIV